MSALQKTSPAAFFQSSLNPEMTTLNGMPIAARFGSQQAESAHKNTLSVCDVSALQRFGVKGPKAAAWLEQHGVTLPSAPNTSLMDDNALIMRLGGSEFLIEDLPGSDVCKALNEAIKTKVAGVYFVAHADAAFVLSGSQLPSLFAELCKLDLSDRAIGKQDVIMTQVADISAVMTQQELNGQQVFRLWCDGTYGAYMWRVLHQLAQELGGGAVGFSSTFK